MLAERRNSLVTSTGTVQGAGDVLHGTDGRGISLAAGPRTPELWMDDPVVDNSAPSEPLD
jgi:hypothetical protein